MASPVSPPEDQSRLLEEALGVVRQQSHMMRKCLETPGKLMDALKCGSTLVSELRTPSLGPKQYYELYMAVFDALRHLSVYLKENHPVNHLADLYELVQYAGNIIPRLYLMITVGTVYMSVEDAPVKEIMKDMMEMSRGVQHPIRGLFLRYYLSGQARDHLPTGSGDGPEGNLQDSINFVLTNFVEMNKLWVRLQHQGPSREREKRMQERRELELLVGSNIVRLSQLVDLERYKSGILQALLEQVVQCRDVLAQEYLLEVITKVFPDEFHLHTLDLLLSAISRLNPHVDLKKIVIGLMDRLSAYAARETESTADPEIRKQNEEDAVTKFLENLKIAEETKKAEVAATQEAPTGTAQENGVEQPSTEPSKEPSKGTNEPEAETPKGEQVSNANDESDAKPGVPADVKLYAIFYDQVVSLIKTRGLPIQDTMALLVSLVNLALNTYPDKLEYVDQVLDFATRETAEYADHADLHAAPTQQNLLHLLLAPLRSYVSIFTALALPHYLPLLTSQSYPTRRSVAGEIARSLLKNRTLITTTENLDRVLGALRVLIKEGLQQAVGYPGSQRRGGETDETIEEQGWLARLVHLIQAPENDVQLKLLQATRKAYADGNERIRYTTPAIITASIRLARKLKSREHYDDNWQSQSSALYRFMHQCVNNLYQRANPGCADLALRLFVMCGEVADQTGFEEFSYEFFAQAFTIYEDSISDSRAQFQAVCIIAGALHGTRGFSKENYDTLITKAALHGSKLLKKPDQCRAVYLASHLWWVVENPQRGEEDPKNLYRDGKRVLECLQRALRVADACMDTAVSVELFVEILNRYVYYFDQQNETVTTKYLNGLIELIHSNLQTNEDEPNPSLEGPKRHFQRTLEYIRSRDYEGVVTDPRQ
ncbi:vacuolar protein sorting-associated protein 35 [Aspergillus udagawae]|uniref:Vacuolar protein sorting-associated protein 35 n=1 Tax=Aspergillus udagawae TaxID=91492 RepID=A0ABQ1AUN4_9EURO|nr:vacuolar protein sorting-associated protein 35 [Aspergillus udagawae]GFF88400.1 vacuolar protein sorting-associated protein 35 [Aspergillus udagawae]GFG03842.1 vacuolar protein sorting-associated protein 35 [Aspergillus udagawae]GFG21084.1 vacuolar protein sorting-associated protein 35 [Aspergillus udagawae]